MKRSPIITAVKSKLDFSSRELEQILFAQHRKHWTWRRKPGPKPVVVCEGYETIALVSVPMRQTGKVQLEFISEPGQQRGRMEIPVGAGFLLTCVQCGKDSYRVAMLASLS